jgi:hypothetical protein
VLGKTVKHVEGGVAETSFNLADVRTVDAGISGQRFLRLTSLASKPA